MWIRLAISLLLLIPMLHGVSPPAVHASCEVQTGTPTYPDGKFIGADLCDANGNKKVTGGGGGTISVSATATTAAPTYTEGQTTAPFSMTLDGALRIVNMYLAGGEHIGTTEADGYMRVTGALGRAFPLMNDVTTNTSSTPTTVPSGGKTPIAWIDGSGSQVVDVTIYGDTSTTATEEFPLCTMNLTGTTHDAKKCDQFTEDYLFYHAKTTNIAGTDATVQVVIMQGIAGSGSGSSSAVTATATAVAPTYAEGSTTSPLSMDLAGNLRMHKGTLDAGENIPANLQEIGFGMTRQTIVATSMTTDATSTSNTVPSGPKTFYGEVTCSSGACVQTQKIYGDTDTNASNGQYLICTITLSATSHPIDVCPPVLANFSFYRVVSSVTSGTGATGTVTAMY